jgi:hypothetical protein
MMQTNLPVIITDIPVSWQTATPTNPILNGLYLPGQVTSAPTS